MSVSILSRGLSRRQFLKTAACSAAVAAVSDKLLVSPTGLFSTAEAAKAPKQDGWYVAGCNMCTQGDCIKKMHVVDGVVVEVVGDPKAPNNQGTQCPRGNASIMTTYNPWRVKTPVKRTNPKKALNEDPKWVEISWDEALNTVADRLKKVKADDPRKLICLWGQGAKTFALTPFETAFGTPNDCGSRGSACAYHTGVNYVQGQGPSAIPDMDRIEYLLVLGKSMGPNYAIASSGTRAFLDAIERGCKIVKVDPKSLIETSKAAEWVPIRNGTEQAFLLGMLNTMLFEIKTMDTWFVKTRTNAPYLIGADGDYARDKTSKKPLIWDEKENRARPFNEIPPMNSALEGSFQVDGAAVTPAFQLIKNAVKPFTPEWQQQITTVPAAKVREIAADFVGHAKIGSTITLDGVSLPFRPVGIQFQRGAYAHSIEGVFGDLVGKIICELVGCLEVPGGITGNTMPPAPLGPDDDGVLKPSGEVAGVAWKYPSDKVEAKIFYPVSHTLVYQMAKNIIDPKGYHLGYTPEILMNLGANPVRGSFGIKTFEQAWATIPFSFTVSLTYDEPAMLSDIVLPDDSFLEKTQWHAGTGSQPHRIMEDATRGIRVFLWRDGSAVSKLYNTRNVEEIVLDLAERTGLLLGKNGWIDNFNKKAGLGALTGANVLDINKRPTLREIAQSVLRQEHGAQKSLEAITTDTGPVYTFFTRGAKNYNYTYFPDNKTRHPMYMVQFLRVGNTLRKNLSTIGLKAPPGWTDIDFFWKAYQPIPVWVPCPESNPPAGYDLWAMNWKTPMAPYLSGDTIGNVWLYDVMNQFDPYEFAVIMNAETAKKKGLKDGDMIVVESRYGKTQGRLKTTETIHPDSVGVPSYHGKMVPGSLMDNPIKSDGPHFNSLCSVFEKDGACCPITGGIEQGPAVKVYKA